MKSLLPLTLAALFGSHALAATVWIGNANGGDGASFFQEANWDTDGATSAPYTTPAANSINPGTVTTAATGILSVTSATLTNISNPVFGDGLGLILSNASISTAGTFGAQGVAGGAGSTIDLTNSSTFNASFIDLDLTVIVGQGSTLILRGTANPLSATSAVNLVSGGTLTFSGGAPSAFNASRIFNATTGVTYSTTGDISGSFSYIGTQANPTSITAVPEPSSVVLLGFAGLGFVRRRR